MHVVQNSEMREPRMQGHHFVQVERFCKWRVVVGWHETGERTVVGEGGDGDGFGDERGKGRMENLSLK